VLLVTVGHVLPLAPAALNHAETFKLPELLTQGACRRLQSSLSKVISELREVDVFTLTLLYPRSHGEEQLAPKHAGAHIAHVPICDHLLLILELRTNILKQL